MVPRPAAWGCDDPGVSGDPWVPATAPAGPSLTPATLGPVHRPLHRRAVHRDRRLGERSGSTPEPDPGRVGDLAGEWRAGPGRDGGAAAGAAGGTAVCHLAGPGGVQRPRRALSARCAA